MDLWGLKMLVLFLAWGAFNLWVGHRTLAWFIEQDLRTIPGRNKWRRVITAYENRDREEERKADEKKTEAA